MLLALTVNMGMSLLLKTVIALLSTQSINIVERVKKKTKRDTVVKIQPLNLPKAAPPYTELSQPANPASPIFPRGVITLINESKIPQNALKEGNNIMLYEDGNPGPRWGTNWYGNAVPNAAVIDGAAYFQTTGGATHVVAVAGGNFYRSTDNAQTWTQATGATITSGAKMYFVQANNFLYATNGTDAIIRYDGSTTLLTYTAISPPTALTVTATGIAGSTFTYYYRVVAVNQIGFTQGTASATVGVTAQRPNWDPTSTGADYVTLSWTAPTGTVVRYDIYVTDNASDNTLNNLFYIGSSQSTTFIDNGQVDPQTSNPVPTQNTSTGPVVGELTLINNRLWGVRDPVNPQRIWWTGSGPFLGYFADSYDGGYVDLENGSSTKAVKTVGYRDGKGSPLITTWFSTPDGLGCVWQTELDEITAADGSTIHIPTSAKLPGSRGTPAANSVVNVLDDYMYYNSQGIYDLGSRANLLSLLSTDEYSANIRPSLQQTNNASAPSIAAYYYLGKVFISVPYGSTTNNATIVYDTQISSKPWMPQAFTTGFERFFQYADTSAQKTVHLLCWKPGDSRLSEISSNIQGDYNQPFATSLITGLTNTTKSRFDWLWTETAYIELSNPQDSINVELIGIERNKGFSSQKTATITSVYTNTGWDTYAWDTIPWDYTAVVPVTYSESSIKRYFTVQRELNAYQFHIYTDSVAASYVLRTLQIDGTPTDTQMPRTWRLR
jgi:hypothetical protein